MDDSVLQAMAKWPHVPHCYGWLGLDGRGQWYMRDDRTQALGRFASGRPGCKGSRLQHQGLIDFIGRNYQADAQGQWFFQNGPQRVYVELEHTALIWRLQPDGLLLDHRGQAGTLQQCVLDEHGWLYLLTDTGFGLLHTQDVSQAADAIEQGQWPQPEQLLQHQLPGRFGYLPSPQSLQNK